MSVKRPVTSGFEATRESKPAERGHDRERVDRAQVADDDAAGRGDRRAHLRRRRLGENRTTVTPKGLPAAVADPVSASAAANAARRRVGRITVLHRFGTSSGVLHHPFWEIRCYESCGLAILR